MNDDYRLPLTKDESILLILKELLHHNTDICKLIIYKKNTIEAKETMEYYYDRWENIAGSHYRLHDTHDGKYSLIWDDSNYKVKKDHNPIFYNLTGISYQIIELIHQLIKLKNDELIENTFITDYKEWIEHDDKLFSFLADKIRIAMNES
jgi:hypothetical protein